MAYLGRGIENLSDRVVLDSLTASATASYTLQLNSVNFVPSSAESLTVSLNGVIQAPISSYTVSGSTLTFASALTSSDSIDFIIAERGITLQTPSAGSVGTSQLASTAVTTAKIADDAVTKDKVSNLMYPAFHARLSATQDISDVTVTKVQFDTKVFDTDNCYDNTTNYRFTPTVAGKYFVYSHIEGDGSGVNKTDQVQLYIQKNGSTYAFLIFYPNTASASNNSGINLNTIVEMNGSTDYIEISAYVDADAVQARIVGNATYSRSAFGAYRIGD
jgi:hypothetical protein